MRSESIHGLSASHSVAAMTSAYGFVSQSGLIESVNSWPKPDEPWKFGHATTYPQDAKVCEFQRKWKLSLAPLWGPPWIASSSGYCLRESKPGG
jgi:hypothetical protein